jgi:hypothetical protein
MAGNKIFSLNLCHQLLKTKLEVDSSLLIILSNKLATLKLNSKLKEAQ